MEMETGKLPLRKRSSTAFLQCVIVLVGGVVLTLLLCEPHFEGRNAHATVFEVYFHDPFLAYAYTASIPFFVALYHGFKVLGYVGRDQIFSSAAVAGLRTIRWCALAIIGFVAGGEVLILMGETDDAPGPIMLGILITFGSIIVATAMATLERILQKALDLKAENDLTV